ncbi:MAG: EutP/PduV family microcompartment system protein [Sebaldella sp.]|nr:EutP/PduV family microcompartment system protein [Sebaldella sp.]
MKKLLLIGKTGCGKTTLVQRINGKALKYEKTQMLSYYDNILDTPGEYMENRGLYKALIVSSYDCDVIAMIQAVDDERSIFPPSFSTAFTKPVIGIVSKSDLEGDISRSEEILKEAGAEKIFLISSYDNEGIEALYEYLADKA